MMNKPINLAMATMLLACLCLLRPCLGGEEVTLGKCSFDKHKGYHETMDKLKPLVGKRYGLLVQYPNKCLKKTFVYKEWYNLVSFYMMGLLCGP